MKSLIKKLWVLPLVAFVFFWGVSMISTPVTNRDHSSPAAIYSGNVVAIAQLNPVNQRHRIQKRNEDVVTIRGTVVRFKEFEELTIDDGRGKIVVEYENKYKPLKLNVGDNITVRGEIDYANNDQPELYALEIYSPWGKVYPQPWLANNVRDLDYSRNDLYADRQESSSTFSNSKTDATSNSNYLLLISEVLSRSQNGEAVTIEGEVFNIPQADIIILKDSTGEISVDIDDAQDTLNLKKGDKVKVKGTIQMNGSNDKQIQALRIEKQS